MIPGAMPPAVVLVLPKSGYRNDDFLAAAKRLGAEVIVASDVCHQLADEWAAALAHHYAVAAPELLGWTLLR